MMYAVLLLTNSPSTTMKTLPSPKSLAVVELSPPPANGTMPALQVKLVASITLKGYTVRVLVKTD